MSAKLLSLALLMLASCGGAPPQVAPRPLAPAELSTLPVSSANDAPPLSPVSASECAALADAYAAVLAGPPIPPSAQPTAAEKRDAAALAGRRVAWSRWATAHWTKAAAGKAFDRGPLRCALASHSEEDFDACLEADPAWRSARAEVRRLGDASPRGADVDPEIMRVIGGLAVDIDGGPCIATLASGLGPGDDALLIEATSLGLMPAVRARAFTLLGLTRTERAFAFLADLLRRPGEIGLGELEAAAAALGRGFGPTREDETLSLLAPLLEAEESAVRGIAVRALRRVPGARAKAALAARARVEKSDEVRGALFPAPPVKSRHAPPIAMCPD